MEHAPQDQSYAVSPRNKKRGLLWILLPIFLLFTVLLIYSIMAFAVEALGLRQETYVLVSVVKVILSLLGIVSVLGIMIGVPIGIITLRKKELMPGKTFDERSGKKGASTVPAEVKGWSWGAAGLGWVWGVYNGVWMSLLMFVPLVSMVWWIVLGLKGNEWAWRAQKWESVAQFQAAQNKWKPWGIAFFVLGVLLALLQATSY